jgi:hypothetical protein
MLGPAEKSEEKKKKGRPLWAPLKFTIAAYGR